MVKSFKKSVHFVTNETVKVSDVLLKHFKLEPERVQNLLKLGALYKNKKRIQQDETLNPKDHLQVYLHPKRYSVHEVEWKDRVVFQNADFVVINKPAGIPIHSTEDNLIENVLYQLREGLGQDLRGTHRLDSSVSGLFVLARTPRFQSAFNEILTKRKIKKHYVALVEHPPEVGKQLHFMSPGEGVPKKLSKTAKPGWLECSLEIIQVEPCFIQEKSFWRVSILLDTGRTHQIRAQLSELGSPILGDKLYRGRNRSGFTKNRLALHASEIEWTDSQGHHRFQVDPSF